MKLFYFLPFVSAIFAAFLSTVQACALEAKGALQSCGVNDMNCLIKFTENFLACTYQGIPELNIVAIDPLFIPAKDVNIEDEGVLYENRNITVKGLKNQKLSYYKMDLNAKSVLLTTAADLSIDSDVTEVFKSGKRIHGHSSSRGSVLGTVSYNYQLKKDNKGIEHFEVGPETVTCKLANPLTIQYNSELQRSLSNDPEARSHSGHSHPLKVFCAIAERAYSRAAHNIRQAARVMPASAFFKDLGGNF